MDQFYGEHLLPTLTFVAHGTSAPTDAEFSAFIQRAQPTPGEPLRCLVISAGGSLTLQQRKKLDAELQKAPSVRTAFVTDSVASRAVLTAVAWVSKLQLKTFPQSAFGDACAFLGLTAAEHTLLQAAVDRATTKLGSALFHLEGKRLSA